MKLAFICSGTLIVAFVMWYWSEGLLATIYELPAMWLIPGGWALFCLGYFFHDGGSSK